LSIIFISTGRRDKKSQKKLVKIRLFALYVKIKEVNMNKASLLSALILLCISSLLNAQIIKAGSYKLYYTEFKNNNENEEFFYLDIEENNTFKIITPYSLSEFPLPDGQNLQHTFTGMLEENDDSIVFHFLNDGTLPHSTPYFGPPKLEIRINKRINENTEYYNGTISVMHVVKPFYFRFEKKSSIPLRIGLDFNTTQLLKTYLEFTQEISRRIKKENRVMDEIYNNIIGNSYKIDIDKNDSAWFTIIFHNKNEAEILFETKQDGVFQSTGRCTYYLYYNHDNVLELAIPHCIPTESGYVIVTEPIFNNQIIKYTGFFIYYNGSIPSSEMGKVK
jgi:hypothetical protein